MQIREDQPAAQIFFVRLFRHLFGTYPARFYIRELCDVCGAYLFGVVPHRQSRTGWITEIAEKLLQTPPFCIDFAYPPVQYVCYLRLAQLLPLGAPGPSLVQESPFFRATHGFTPSAFRFVIPPPGHTHELPPWSDADDLEESEAEEEVQGTWARDVEFAFQAASLGSPDDVGY